MKVSMFFDLFNFGGIDLAHHPAIVAQTDKVTVRHFAVGCAMSLGSAKARFLMTNTQAQQTSGTGIGAIEWIPNADFAGFEPQSDIGIATVSISSPQTLMASSGLPGTALHLKWNAVRNMAGILELKTVGKKIDAACAILN